MAIVDIRGTSGSGKTFIIRQLLDANKHTTVSKDGKVVGYNFENCLVLGRYTKVGGGCDSFKGGAKQVDALLREYHPRYEHIALEGLMISHLFQRFLDLANELGDYHFMFLDTPLKTCIERVRERRLAKGNSKPFEPLKNLIPEYKRIKYSVRVKLKASGCNVYKLNHKEPMPEVLRLLGLS